MSSHAAIGLAFEWAVCQAVADSLAQQRSEGGLSTAQPCVQLVHNRRLQRLGQRFSALPATAQQQMRQAATAGLRRLIALEPRLAAATPEDPVLVRAGGHSGALGDARDVFLSRWCGGREPSARLPGMTEDAWEAGISCKWHHTAVKHPRLSAHLDFGRKWLGYPCSERYWREVAVPFSQLRAQPGRKWSSLSDRAGLIFQPVMDAFLRELRRLADAHQDVPGRLAQYLVGPADSYRLIGWPGTRSTEVQACNLGNTLHEGNGAPDKRVRLPGRLVEADWLSGSRTTVRLKLDQDWSFTLRAHNGEALLRPTIKLDVNLVTSPFANWNEPW